MTNARVTVLAGLDDETIKEDYNNIMKNGHLHSLYTYFIMTIRL